VLRLDAAWYGSTGFGLVDPIAGPWFTAKNVQLALRAGDPHRIIRALAWEAGTRGAGPPAVARSAARLFRTAGELLERYDDPHTRAVYLMSRGTFHFTDGSWVAAQADLVEAERILTEECRGVRWEVASVRIFRQYTSIFLGEVQELRQNVARWLDEARDLGDLFLETNLLLVGQSTLQIVDANPQAGFAITRAALARWPSRELDLLQVTGFTCDVWRMLGMGMVDECWATVQRQWPVLEKYFLLKSRYLGTVARYLRGRSAVAKGGEEMLRIAESDARAIRRMTGVAFAPGMAACLEACIARRRGNRELAAQQWAEAWRTFEKTSTFLLAAPARRQYGLLLGGEEGGAHVAAAEDTMRAQGVRDYDIMCRTYVACLQPD
jgi:hypothetical protein